MLALLDRFEKTQPFSDSEAWFLFKVAAFSEAFGWSLLITGILIKHFFTPSSNLPVLIAGRMHGVFFLIYLMAAIGLYTSLRWSRKRVFIAALASVPPYGSLFFEQWASYKRRNEKRKAYREITVYAIIIKNQSVLAIKPRHSGYHYLPGGIARPNEAAEESLKNIVEQQLGIGLSVERLLYIHQYRQKEVEKLDLFFSANLKSKYNPANAKLPKEIDEVDYIKPLDNDAILPEFLRTEDIIKAAVNKNSSVKFI